MLLRGRFRLYTVALAAHIGCCRVPGTLLLHQAPGALAGMLGPLLQQSKDVFLQAHNFLPSVGVLCFKCLQSSVGSLSAAAGSDWPASRNSMAACSAGYFVTQRLHAAKQLCSTCCSAHKLCCGASRGRKCMPNGTGVLGKAPRTPCATQSKLRNLA